MAGHDDLSYEASIHVILIGMPRMTTIKVSIETRDALRQLAEGTGMTFDAQLRSLIRAERQRAMGLQLSGSSLGADDIAVLDSSAADITDALR